MKFAKNKGTTSQKQIEKGTIKCEQGLLKVNNFLNGWGKTMLYRAYYKGYLCVYVHTLVLNFYPRRFQKVSRFACEVRTLPVCKRFRTRTSEESW